MSRLSKIWWFLRRCVVVSRVDQTECGDKRKREVDDAENGGVCKVLTSIHYLCLDEEVSRVAR